MTSLLLDMPSSFQKPVEHILSMIKDLPTTSGTTLTFTGKSIFPMSKPMMRLF